VGQAPTRDIGTPDLDWIYGLGSMGDPWETSPALIWPSSIETFGRMRHDPQLRAVLSAYMLPLRRATWAVDPAGCKDQVTRHVADDLGITILGSDEGPGPARRRGVVWARHLEIALQHLIYGHMPFELRYRIDNDRPGGCHLDHLGERLPQTIAEIKLNRDATVNHVLQSTQRTPIPANRLIWYVIGHAGANWTGISMLRPAYAAWLIKSEMWRVHGTSIRRFGMGVPYVEAPPGGTAAQVAQARDLAMAMRAGEQSGAGIPQGFKPMLMGLTGSVPDALGFIRYLDQAMAKMALAGLIELGQTETGSRALGETFLDLFLLSLQAVADEIATTATSGQDGMPGIVTDLVDQNWGTDEPAPRIVCTDVGENYQVTAEALATLVSSKALTPDPALEAWIRRTWRLPELEETAGPPAVPAPPGGSALPGAPGESPPAPGPPGGQPLETAASVPPGPGHGPDVLADATFEKAHPRGFHGYWTHVGGSQFTFDGPPGGGGHVRAIMAVADIIEPEPGGQDIAIDIRNSAKAMYERDMPAAYRHIDGAIYLDGIYRGGQHRDDLEAIKRSYADVPKGAQPLEEMPTGPAGFGRKGELMPPGLVGAEAGEPEGDPWEAMAEVLAKSISHAFKDALHPRVPGGKPGGGQFTKAPGGEGGGKHPGAVGGELFGLTPEPPPATKTGKPPSLGAMAFGAPDSLTEHTIRHSGLTPERQALHNKIIAETLAGHKPHRHPEAVFMGGTPGAGKSTVLGETPPDTVLIASDAVKPRLPEYRTHGKEGAVYTHMESAAIAYRAQDEATAKHYNIAVDGVGDSGPGKMNGWIQQVKDQGYRTSAKYVAIDPDEAIKRAKIRAKKTGRFVPETVIREQARTVAQVFPTLVGGDLLDEAELWDNNGAKAKLIGRKRAGGKWEVLDAKAWDRFRKQGGG
jgi:predicted ABC-type ATPase